MYVYIFIVITYSTYIELLKDEIHRNLVKVVFSRYVTVKNVESIRWTQFSLQGVSAEENIFHCKVSAEKDHHMKEKQWKLWQPKEIQKLFLNYSFYIIYNLYLKQSTA